MLNNHVILSRKGLQDVKNELILAFCRFWGSEFSTCRNWLSLALFREPFKGLQFGVFNVRCVWFAKSYVYTFFSKLMCTLSSEFTQNWRVAIVMRYSRKSCHFASADIRFIAIGDYRRNAHSMWSSRRSLIRGRGLARFLTIVLGFKLPVDIVWCQRAVFPSLAVLVTLLNVIVDF